MAECTPHSHGVHMQAGTPNTHIHTQDCDTVLGGKRMCMPDSHKNYLNEAE